MERSRYRCCSGRDMTKFIVALLTFAFCPHDTIRVCYSAKKQQIFPYFLVMYWLSQKRRVPWEVRTEFLIIIHVLLIKWTVKLIFYIFCSSTTGLSLMCVVYCPCKSDKNSCSPCPVCAFGCNFFFFVTRIQQTFWLQAKNFSIPNFRFYFHFGLNFWTLIWVFGGLYC